MGMMVDGLAVVPLFGCSVIPFFRWTVFRLTVFLCSILLGLSDNLMVPFFINKIKKEFLFFR